MKRILKKPIDGIRRVFRWIVYGLWLLKEIIVNAYYMAFDVNHRKSKISPAIIRFPIRHMTSPEVVVLAASITMTPGSLVLAIDRGEPTETSSIDSVSSKGEHGYLLIHIVYAADLEQERAGINDVRSHVMRASRGWKWKEGDE